MGAMLVVLLGVLAAMVGLVAWRRRRLGVALASGARFDEGPDTLALDRPARGGVIARWLRRAGYARPDAAALFLMATAACLLAGVAAGFLARSVADTLAATLRDLPGGVGEMLGSTVTLLPWGLGLELAVAPLLVVRAARARRVEAIEQDLPLVLELLATMAQAGLAVDAALARVVAFQPQGRPLTRELRLFQRDLLVGTPRLTALRQLAERNDVTSLSIFVAAVIQAEQVGASIGDTLRFQADDVRARRRERALLLAQALPVKLVVPLVVCFLPGIFLSTLGPVLYQMMQVADSVLRR